jgi:hypothetical protein
MIDHLLEVRLPFALHAGDIEFAGGDQPVDQGILADRADDDRLIVLGRVVAADLGEIAAQVVGGAQHRGIVLRIGDDRDGMPVRDQGECGAEAGRADCRRAITGGESRRRQRCQNEGEKEFHTRDRASPSDAAMASRIGCGLKSAS